MNELVHPDQVGFIPGREGRDNGVRTLLLLQEIKINESPGLFLSIDAEKAFDRVDWGLMIKTIRANADIGGINIGKDEHKLAAFADNVLFYISNPRITLPNLLRTLKQYGELSNFKINLNKSEILNININKQEVQSLQKDF